MKRSDDISRIRQLIWLYFWLLLFEGALRKWIVPSASSVLLVVRDPVVVAIYFLSLRARLFPRNTFVVCAGILALATMMVSSLADQGNSIVTLYGARTNFLQLPLIFLIPRVFDVRDVERIGFYVLALCLPIALLMVVQFRSPSSAWINVGVEATVTQIASAGGHIRPPGPFSFITGPVFFYSLATVYLLDSQFSSRPYPIWLSLTALLSLGLAAAVSGSRSFLAGVGVVCFFGLIYALLRLQLKTRWLYSGLLLLLGGMVLSRAPIFQEGLSVLFDRISHAGQVEGGTSGFTGRFLSGFIGIGPTLTAAPALGHGLGVGTTAGAALLTGTPQFLLAEGEWDRVILESGPALGLGFIAYRVALTLWLGFLSIKQASGHGALPFLLFSSVSVSLSVGQLGQPTLLGFTILGSGLCLAAMRPPRLAGSDSSARTSQRGRHAGRAQRAPSVSASPTSPVPVSLRRASTSL